MAGSLQDSEVRFLARHWKTNLGKLISQPAADNPVNLIIWQNAIAESR